MIFRFESPWLLLLLLLLPLLAWWSWTRRRRSRPSLAYSGAQRLEKAGGAEAVWLEAAPLALRMLSLACLMVALARPQTGVTSETARAEGIDIVLVQDVSTSMLAEDIAPNRLEAAKAVAAEFVAGRRNDRIGLVAFAGRAFTQAPLTLDHSVVASVAADLEAGMLGDGTAVGMGLATAVKRLHGSEAASKVVVLLTDGRSNAGEIDPLTAAQMAQALGVRVYTIGAGSVQGIRPFGGLLQQGAGEADMDEESLRAIAQITGGQYFRATDRESLGAVYREIDRLETTEMLVENFTRYGERFQGLLIAGLALLLLEVALRRTWLRTLP